MVSEEIFEIEEQMCLQPYQNQIIGMEKSARYEGCFYQFLNVEKLELIARIACSRGMTLPQVLCFLRLQGYSIEDNKVREYLNELSDYDIIRTLTIQTEIKTIMQEEKGIKFYWLGRQGWDIAKALRVPVPTKGQTSQMFLNYGKKRYILSSVLWNQIILNQLLYNDNIVNFRIHDTVNLPNGKVIHIPLILRTRNQDYVFEYIRGKYLKQAYIQTILLQWAEYMQYMKTKFLLVLVGEHNIAVRRIKQIVDTINDYDIKIFYTEDRLWWNKESGIVYTWSYVDSQEICMSIDNL